MQHTAAVGLAAPHTEVPKEPDAGVPNAPHAAWVTPCDRITDQVVRAYGVAFTWWMTGRDGFDLGPGSRAEQHGRISQHYRRALRDSIEQEIARPENASGCLGAESPKEVQAAKQAVHQRARALFLRGQYRVNLLFFTLFADLERERKRLGAESCLLGATPPPGRLSERSKP